MNGHIVTTAENGSQALDRLMEAYDTREIDMELSDLQMPVMNGFEASEYIRNTMKSNIPIIALTADVTTADVTKCKNVGMNDFISKPVDERILYNKIMSLVKKQVELNSVQHGKDGNKLKYTNLEYLHKRTKSNPDLILEMIELYLEQTPSLIQTMKQSYKNQDWELLHSAAHKIIPSFSIMGISDDFESMAKKIQEYATTQEQLEGIHSLVLELENVCTQACHELEEEYNIIKKTKNAK
jgi:CheY-like chemotaxis protein